MAAEKGLETAARIRELEDRLEEAEETLRALRSGEVDAVVVSGPGGERVYTLKGADEAYRVMVQEMAEGALTLTPGGLILFSNQQFASMLGIGLQHLIGSSIHELIVAQDAPILAAILSGSPGTKAELRLRKQTDAPVPVLVSANPLLFDGTECVCLIVTDLTGQKRNEEMATAERLARESESRLRTLSDNLPEGAIYRYRHDAQGEPHVDFISGGIEGLTGVPAAEFMADAGTVYRNILSEDHDRLDAAIVVSRERLKRFEVEVRRKHRVTGEIRWSLLRATPTRNPDGSTTWDGIELDITGRKRVEEALREHQSKLAERSIQLERAGAELEKRNREVERVNRMKTEFLARISHELRTPLNAIVGYADLLTEQSSAPLPAPYPRFVSNIQEGARHLLDMVNDLLDISRIEAGRIELNLERFDVSVALEEVMSVIEPLAGIKSISIDSRVARGTTVLADRVRCKQILYNLMSNAVKFTPEEGRVWVETATEEERFTICVADTGIGIAPGEQEAIFEEFHQVASAKKLSAAGAGLGLAITRKLARLHGGDVRVESRMGQGSRFLVSLPASGETSPGRESLAQGAGG